jgi:uncharacterized protein (DUF924 family)
METWECTLSGISDRHKESVRRFWRNKVLGRVSTEEEMGCLREG